MLKSLHYSVTFPTTARSFDAAITFDPGLTAITGPNEAGKSLILEMIRYALFGKAALRGAASDYKTLKVTLELMLGERLYRIERTAKQERLLDGEGTVIATGAAVLNAKIPELLGFGLKVFDAACACNQGEIEALGRMRPTERRRMVDSVIGLDVIEELRSWAAAEANGHRRSYDAISAHLTAPEAPSMPHDYIPSPDLQAALDDLLVRQATKARLEALIATAPVAPGPRPVRPAVAETAAELEQLVEAHRHLRDQLNLLAHDHDRIPDADHSLADLTAQGRQWELYEQYMTRERALAALGPKPEVTREAAEAGLRQWDAYHGWEIKRDLLARGHHECPACHHQWPIADLGAVADAMETAEPAHLRLWYDQQIKAAEAWDDAPAPLPAVDHPKLSRPEIAFHTAALARAEVKRELKVRINEAQAELEMMPDRSADLRALRDYDSNIAHYQEKARAYDAWVQQAQAARAALQDLQGLTEEISRFSHRLSEARVFEAATRAYDEALLQYRDRVLAADELKATSDQYRAAAEALKILRSKIKQHLVPSLNKVASRLLNRMTGGERNRILVDEDFAITVDGQPLDTLSGSGKSVANLAIRIGLGQVLTAKVFPVFMGDEIDAAMDADRAGYTADCLRALTAMISQVILVTHKRPEADQVVEIG